MYTIVTAISLWGGAICYFLIEFTEKTELHPFSMQVKITTTHWARWFRISQPHRVGIGQPGKVRGQTFGSSASQVTVGCSALQGDLGKSRTISVLNFLFLFLRQPVPQLPGLRSGLREFHFVIQGTALQQMGSGMSLFSSTFPTFKCLSLKCVNMQI